MTPPFLDIDHVDKHFHLDGGHTYHALQSIDLTVRQGEFVSLIGHSGCGKSTLLNIIAGLDKATAGGIILEGREIAGPGPDRMVVFQNYSLLPWLTVRQNISLAVNRVLRQLPKSERQEIIERNIDRVGLRAAADRRPSQLSGGMKQRVAIARALALRPKVLLLDEPFGALDALTRGNMQEQLMQICQENQMTCVMVTHDVDEALLLSDRVIMLTNGPAARIGQILEVPIPRPRHRLEVIEHPNYYGLRGEIVYFLNQQKRAKRRKAVQSSVVMATGSRLEKATLEIGFIPLTDCAPLVVAKEKGFFAQQGLDVTLSRKPSWKAISQSVISGELDAAQMVAGMPLALTLGMDNIPTPIITAFTLSRNGSAITFDRHFLEQGVRDGASLKQKLAASPESSHLLGVVHPASMQNLLLRYWLAASDIDPDRDVNISVFSPIQMAVNLKAAKIDGYCCGDPWNSRAVHEATGYVIAPTMNIWAGHPEKVLGVREDWANVHPNTHIALLKALMEACEYCDDWRNREEILDLLCQPQYVDANPAYARMGFIDHYDRGWGEEPEPLLRFNQFYVDKANYPNPTEALWILTQLARWDLTPFPKNWQEVIERVYRLDLYNQAATQLELPVLEPNRTAFALFDGMVFDPNDPIGYIQRLTIHRDLRISEVNLDAIPQKVA